MLSGALLLFFIRLAITMLIKKSQRTKGRLDQPTILVERMLVRSHVETVTVICIDPKGNALHQSICSETREEIVQAFDVKLLSRQPEQLPSFKPSVDVGQIDVTVDI